MAVPRCLVLGLDIGTSKLGLVAADGATLEPVAARTAPNDAEVPGLAAGRHEQDPIRVRDRCFALIREIIAEQKLAGRVAAIGISGQMHGVLLVDADLTPLTNLITWRDQRTADADRPGSVAAARDALGAEAPRRTGCRLSVGYGGATLHWLARHGQLPASVTALSMADFVAASLTGIAATEVTHAASWGICDVATNAWDALSPGTLGIPPRVLPEIRLSGRPLGGLTASAAEDTGLTEAVQVCSPVGDGQAAVIATAGGEDDTAVLNLGTGGQISIPRPEYVYSEPLETRPMPRGGYIQVGATLCSGWAYAYLRRFFQATVEALTGARPDDEAVYAGMNALGVQAGAGADGLVVDPRFNGTRVEPARRGAVTGINVGNLTPANLCRAAVEGMVRELYELASAAGIADVKRVAAAGNAVRKNPLVREVIEQIFALPCVPAAAEEEAALGAARLTAADPGP